MLCKWRMLCDSGFISFGYRTLACALRLDDVGVCVGILFTVSRMLFWSGVVLVYDKHCSHLSQSGPNDAIGIQPLDSHIKAPTPTLHGDTQMAGVFPASSTTSYASYTRQTPMARAGGSRRRRGRLSRGRRVGKQSGVRRKTFRNK